MKSQPELMPVRTADDARFELRVTCTDAANAPLLHFVPAMGVEARYYDALGRGFAEAGVNFACSELRGHGSSSLRASWSTDFGYREVLEQDFPAANEVLRSRFDQAPLLMGGHSLGGQLATVFAAANPGLLSGLALIATCNVWYRGWDKAMTLLISTQMLAVTAHIVGHLPGRTIGFGGREARRLMRDWARTARTGDYRVSGSATDYEQLLAELTLPVLSVSIEGDDYAPPAAVDNLTNKLKSADVQRWHLGPEETQLDRANHFNWARDTDEVARRVAHWILENA